MSKKNQKTIIAEETESIGKDVVETVVEEPATEPKMKDNKVKKQKEPKENKKANAKKSQSGEVKRSRIKETFAELKKVTWPSFGKTMKQTGMVLSVVLVFGVVVFGFDLLISYIIKLLSSL